MNTLERIATAELPMIFTEAHDIELVESLVAAGYIKVSTAGTDSPDRFIEVVALTNLGEEVATRFLPPSERQELPVEKRRRSLQLAKWIGVSGFALLGVLVVTRCGGL